MSRIKDVLQFIKHERGRAGRQQKRVFPDRVPSVEGRCVNNAEVARRFKGQHWRSDETDVSTSKTKKQETRATGRDTGHSVAVVKTRGRSGVIVDYSDAREPIQATVQDVSNPKEIKETLRRVYLDDGWRKIR